MRIGFFGAGNMARAISLSLKVKFPSYHFYFYSPSKNSAKALARDLSGYSVESLEDMPSDLDWYILAFKPQNLSQFNYNFRSDSKLVSILAGVSITKLYNKFSVSKIVRLMPNLPCVVSAGANLVFFPNSFCEMEKEEFKSWISSCGSTFFLDSEDQIDKVTPFSGSGPALILEFARIFQSELLSTSSMAYESRDLVVQTFLGTSLLMKNSNLSFSEMRDQVVSKKGVTYEALKVFESEGLTNLFHKAFESAYRRTIELSQEG